MMRLALLQMMVAPAEPERNLARAEERIREAAGRGAELVLLPEALDCGWTHPAARKLAAAVPGGDAPERLQQAARDNGVTVCAGIGERGGERLDKAQYMNSGMRQCGTSDCGGVGRLAVHRVVDGAGTGRRSGGAAGLWARGGGNDDGGNPRRESECLTVIFHRASGSRGNGASGVVEFEDRFDFHDDIARGADSCQRRSRP